MSKELMNLFLFIFMCFILYLIFRHFNYEKTIIKEGLTDLSGNMIISPPNGIAGNASRYAATIKAESIQMQDLFLINKYRTDYESIILNLDDYLNNTMLNTVLTIDYTKPDIAIAKLNSFNQAKQALNSLMKYVDTSK